MTRFQFVLTLLSPVLAFFGIKKLPEVSDKFLWEEQADVLARLQTQYYSKRALDRLQKKFVFRDKFDAVKTMPCRKGNTVQFFRYDSFSGHGV